MHHIYAGGSGAILDTAKAVQSWKETSYAEGNPDGTRWTRGVRMTETLYRSAKGMYWLETVFNWRGMAPMARMLTPREAAAWLLMQRHALPDDLAEIARDIAE